MTHRERLLAVARGEPVDRVPIDPPISFDPIAWDEKGADCAPQGDPLWAEVAASCNVSQAVGYWVCQFVPMDV